MNIYITQVDQFTNKIAHYKIKTQNFRAEISYYTLNYNVSKLKVKSKVKSKTSDKIYAQVGIMNM